MIIFLTCSHLWLFGAAVVVYSDYTNCILAQTRVREYKYMYVYIYLFSVSARSIIYVYGRVECLLLLCVCVEWRKGERVDEWNSVNVELRRRANLGYTWWKRDRIYSIVISRFQYRGPLERYGNSWWWLWSGVFKVSVERGIFFFFFLMIFSFFGYSWNFIFVPFFIGVLNER